MKSDAPYRMKMCKFRFLAVLWSFLVVLSVFCVDFVRAGTTLETEKILSKKHRKLKPPPKSLLAHRYSAENRYDVAWKRTLKRSRLGETQTSQPLARGGKRQKNVMSRSSGRSSAQRLRPMQLAQNEPSVYGDVPAYESRRTVAPVFSSSRAGQGRSQVKAPSVKNSFLSLSLVGAGVYGVLGFEADVRLGDWNVGGGLGTGYDFRTWALRGRYYFSQKKLVPFFEAGYAHWSLSSTPKDNKPGFPGYLTKRFFSQADASRIKARRVNILYPGVGLLYAGPYHFAISLQAQYLVDVKDFQGGLIGSLGLVKFF